MGQCHGGQEARGLEMLRAVVVTHRAESWQMSGRPVGAVTRDVLLRIHLKAEPDGRAGVPGVELGGDPRRQKRGSIKCDAERRNVSKMCINKWITIMDWLPCPTQNSCVEIQLPMWWY